MERTTETSKCAVSVVMPVHNGAPFVREAVDSILAQTLADFEFIIVDDGSTDGSSDILDSYRSADSRVTVLHQPKGGIAVSLNTGIDAARGRYIARMDADDISLPERLAKQVEFMESRPEIGVCGTACKYFGDRHDTIRPPTEPDAVKCGLLFAPSMVHPSVMMRRELMIRRGLHYRADYEEGEDYELWVRFSRCSQITNLPQVLVLARIHADQKHQRRGKDMDEWACLIQRDTIRALGIEPTNAEMEAHRTLWRYDFAGTVDYVLAIEKWLCKLLDGNEKTQVYDQGALARTLAYRWLLACLAAAGSGDWAWTTYRESRLTDLSEVTIRRRLSFLARRILRKRYA